MPEPHFDHSYARLGNQFYSEQPLVPVHHPELLLWNTALASKLDWPGDPRSDRELLLALAGNNYLPDSKPISTVYAGHQFGQYNPQLGDGRAILLGEWITRSENRFDIQLKGSGPTPYSRGGDGRSPIGPVIREYLVSEAMHALGVPTSRALAAISSGETVVRNRIEPGAILTRVASSHLRIGTVQYFAMTRGGEGLVELVDYALNRHFSKRKITGQQPIVENLSSSGNNAGSFTIGCERSDPTAAEILLKAVGESLADLVSRWQLLGFVHGVLNTDNALLCGETIDYGPCAFMDQFDAKACFSSIDRQGRYAWPNQPGIMHWNLAVLAECLIPLIDEKTETAKSIAQSIVDRFPNQFHQHHQERLAAKFGLDRISDQDLALIQKFHDLMNKHQLDFTLSFRWLAEEANQTIDHSPLPEIFNTPDALLDWSALWKARRAENKGDTKTITQAMLSVNPAVIPRNHLVQAAIDLAESGDINFLRSSTERWRKPFDWQEKDSEWARSPSTEEKVTRTFCGT